MSNIEIEATLAICSVTPTLVADEIAELTSIGPYQLRPLPELAIRDVYIDFADHALRSHELGMRVRLTDGSPLITLKGRPEEVAGGGRRREELELAWCEDALNSIVARLADVGLVLAPPSGSLEWHDPLAVLSAMGFVAEQARSTRRRPRYVMHMGNPTTNLAELVVDSVSYHFFFGDVLHHEVEIEVKGEDGIVAMQVIADDLLARWPAALRVWDHGKRSTGRVVEALVAERGTKGLITDAGDLVPAAYDLIASHLS